jgi:hypothetical protein
MARKRLENTKYNDLANLYLAASIKSEGRNEGVVALFFGT